MKFIATIILLVLSVSCFSQKDPVERIWYNAEKTSKIQVFKATNGKYYGKIVWLKVPTGDDGKQRLDNQNPDKTKQTNPLLNLLILTGFDKSKKEGEFTGGKVYDPNNGKTYCGKVTLNGDKLELRGYICSFSWLGRTSEWTLAE